MLILQIAVGLVLGVAVVRLVDHLELWPLLGVLALGIVGLAVVGALTLYWIANPADFRTAIEMTPLFAILAAAYYGIYRFNRWLDRRRADRVAAQQSTPARRR